MCNLRSLYACGGGDAAAEWKGGTRRSNKNYQVKNYSECFNTNSKAGYDHLSAGRKESSPSGYVVALALLLSHQAQQKALPDAGKTRQGAC